MKLQPYRFEVEKGHTVSVARLAPAVILYLDRTADMASALVQPPAPLRGRANLPHFEFSLASPRPASRDARGAELMAILGPHLQGLAAVVTAQVAAGEFRRARPYGRLLAAAARVASGREAAGHDLAEGDAGGQEWGVAQLLHLAALLDVDLECGPGHRAEADPAPARGVSCSSIATEIVGPDFVWDERLLCDLLWGDRSLVAIAPRESRMDVIAQGFADRTRPVLSSKSVVAPVWRLLDESRAQHLERVGAAAKAAVEMARALSGAVEPSESSASLEEWSGWFNVAAPRGHLCFASSTAVLPLPSRDGRWRWPMWTNRRELGVVVLSGPSLDGVTVEPWKGPEPPSRGGGLLKNDRALRAVLETTERLSAEYRLGGTCTSSQSEAWLSAASSVVHQDWWAVLRAASPSWMKWIEMDGR